MAKKCPPGVICIESMTFTLVLLLLGYIIYQNIYKPVLQEKDSIPHNFYIPPPTYNQEITTKLPGNIPITVHTQRMETTFRQVGILTRVNQKETILPLYGKMVNTSRVKWNYYTMNDSNNQVKLPVYVNGKSGTEEYGVDELYSGDTIYVQGYDDVFKVTIYENNRFFYSPF